MWFGFLDFISSVFESFLVVLQDPNMVFFYFFDIFSGQRGKKDRGKHLMVLAHRLFVLDFFFFFYWVRVIEEGSQSFH